MAIGVITPTVIWVQEKVEKAADLMIIKGQLSTELLMANNAKEANHTAWNNAPNKVVQKYGEIYCYQARREIQADEIEEDRVVNMRKKKLWDP